MKRLDAITRSQVLAEGDARVWERLAEEIVNSSHVNIVRPPTRRLATMRAREPVEGIVFNLGEVLVTECEVELNNIRGWGYVLGDDPAKAVAIATIDAALNADHALKDKILHKLRTQKEALDWQQEAEYTLVGETRVDFEAMEESM